jgi:hypothetical protein
VLPALQVVQALDDSSLPMMLRPSDSSIQQTVLVLPEFIENKRRRSSNPLAKWYPISKPGVVAGTGFEPDVVCRFVVQMENMLGERGQWCSLFGEAVDSLHAWNYGGPPPTIAVWEAYRRTLAALNARFLSRFGDV